MELIYAYIHQFRNIYAQEVNFSASFPVSYKESQLSIQHQPHPFCTMLFKENNFTSLHLIIGKTGAGKSNLLTLLGMTYEERKIDAAENGSTYFLVYHIKDCLYFLESSGYTFTEEGCLLSHSNTLVEAHYCSIDSKGILYPTESHAQLPSIRTLNMKPMKKESEKNDLPTISPFITRYNCFFDSHYNILTHLEKYLFKFASTNTSFIAGKSLFCKISIQHFSSPFQRNSFSFQEKFLDNFRQIYGSYIQSLTKTKAPIINFETDYDLYNFYSQNVSPYLSMEDKLYTITTKSYGTIVELVSKIPEQLFMDNCIYWKIGDIPSSDLETIHRLIQELSIWIFNKESKISSIFNISYDNLSSGELQFVSVFSKLEQLCDDIAMNFQPTIILMDEPETYMHPELCRQFIFYLTQMCKSKTKKLDCQFIISSHSPFLLSDVPSECVTCLTMNSNTGKCNVMQNKTKTFGSNIHQLLADSFFLDNTIGEFSYQYIHEMILFLIRISEETNKGKSLSNDDTLLLESYSSILPYIGDAVIFNKVTELINFIKKGK